jgi:tRNA uridine 5-carbamoylmethylation protein Kti12
LCDETNYSRAARNALKDESWETKFYPILTPADVCIDRAYKTGQPDLEPVIKEMAARYEPLGPDEEVYVESD